MATLDSFLNTVIPIGVILVFLAILYWKLKKPLDLMFGWIWGLFGGFKDKVQDTGEYVTVYKYGE